MKYICLLFFIFLSTITFSQSNIFSAGLVAGLNFAELEGEEITDYVGLNVGFMGSAKISKNTGIGLEILFSQNGEYVLPDYYPQISYGKITLNHLEVPLHIDWFISVFKRDKFQNIALHFGLAYAVLINYSIESADKNDVSDQIIYGSKEAILAQPALTYKLNENFGLNLKATLPLRVDGLDWTLAARIIYSI